MRYYVYIIRSTVKKWFYIGLTQNLEKRLLQHNLGKVTSTKIYRPFNLIFAQIVNSRKEARDIEIFLKVRFNKEALLDLILPGW